MRLETSRLDKDRAAFQPSFRCLFSSDRSLEGPTHPAREPSQSDAGKHDERADKREHSEPEVFDDETTDPGSHGDAEIESANVQPGSDIDSTGRDLAGDGDRIALQRRHVGEGKTAPDGNYGDRSNR